MFADSEAGTFRARSNDPRGEDSPEFGPGNGGARPGEAIPPLRQLAGPPPGPASEPAPIGGDERNPATDGIGPARTASRVRQRHVPVPVADEIALTRAAPVRAPIPHPAIAPAPAATPAPAPLSAAAIEARCASAPAPRPVIHVTIDRLDVRAPGRAERAPAPAKRRAPSPSVSLADYLRGRGPGSSGGTP